VLTCNPRQPTARWGGDRCEVDRCPSGQDCDQDADECASRPCQHGATCLESSAHGPVATGFYQCECTEGWGGFNCASAADVCAANGGRGPCRNAGACSQVPRSAAQRTQSPRTHPITDALSPAAFLLLLFPTP
jgi:hypothetical protein